jgi:hypothetical protein
MKVLVCLTRFALLETVVCALLLTVSVAHAAAPTWETQRIPSKSWARVFDLMKVPKSLPLMAVFTPDGTCTALINKSEKEELVPLLKQSLAAKSKSCNFVNTGPGEAGLGVSSIDVYVFDDIACPPCVLALANLKSYTQSLGDKAPKVRVLVVDPSDQPPRQQPCTDCKAPEAKAGSKN